MILGIDLDGVVANFADAVRETYRVWFDGEIPPWTSWNHYEEHTRFSSIGELYDWLLDVPGFWRSLEPIPGALGALRDFRDEGHTLKFITHRPDWAWVDTNEWLKDYGFGTVELHFADDKLSVPAQVYIDDGPHVVEALVKAGGPLVVRYVQPWNVPVKGAVDAESWADVKEIVAKVVACN